MIRYELALKNHRSLFRPFSIPKPYSSPKDVFCIRQHRISDGYRKISIAGHSFQIPKIEPRDDVEIRIWTSTYFVHTTHLLLIEVDNMDQF